MDKWREQMQQLRSDGKVDVVAATPAPGCMGAKSIVGKSVGDDPRHSGPGGWSSRSDLGAVPT